MDSEKKVSANRNIAVSILAFFVLLSCWSFGSSIGSGGDIDAHISSIWCAWGEKPGMCENDTGSIATVPYMFQMCDGRPIDSWPNCESSQSSETMQELRIIPKVQRSPYYSMMRVFATTNPQQSILKMRMVNTLIASVILLGLLKLTSGRTRVAAISAMTFTLVPVAIMRISSINPQGWATLGVMTSWAFLHGFLNTPKTDKRKKWLLAFFVFSVLLPATTRIDSTTYVVFTSAIVLLNHYRTARRFSKKETTIGLGLIAVGLSIITLSEHIRGYLLLSKPIGSQFNQYLVFQIVHIPESLVEVFGYAVGQQGNGPGLVGIVGLSLFVVSLTFALQQSQKQDFVITGVIIAFLAIVMYKGSLITLSLVPLTGAYALGLMSFLLGMSIVRSRNDQQFMDGRANRITVITFLTFTHALTFFSWMELYTHGQSSVGFFSKQILGSYNRLGLSGGWWWDNPIGPNVVFLLGIASFPLFLVYAWRVVELDHQSTE
jgi:hypothetical protein